MVQLSKWFLGCQVSNETKPKLCIFFSILEKSNKTMAQCFKLFLKNCIILFCLISPEMSHLKPDIERYILSTESFFRNICGLRYLTNNSELLINHQSSIFSLFFKNIDQQDLVFSVKLQLSKTFAFASFLSLQFRSSVFSLQRSFSLKFILGLKKI